MKSLTDNQRRVLEVLVRSTEAGHQSSIREMAAQLSMLVGSVHACVDALEVKGFIQPRLARHTRGIQFLRNPDGSEYLPPGVRLMVLQQAIGCADTTFEAALETARRLRRAC